MTYPQEDLNIYTVGSDPIKDPICRRDPEYGSEFDDGSRKRTCHRKKASGNDTVGAGGYNRDTATESCENRERKAYPDACGTGEIRIGVGKAYRDKSM